MPGQPVQTIYVTTHGRWKSGSPWVGESFQFGIRLQPYFPIATPPLGSVYNLPTAGLASVTAEPHSETGSGTNGTLVQTWRLDGEGVPPTVFGGPEMIDCAEDIRVFLNVLKTYQTTDVEWTHMKFAAIRPDGAYAEPSSIYTLTTPLAGVAATGTAFPPEVACALSMRAPVIGRRGRGRIYLGGIAQALGATGGVVSSAAASTLGTAFKDMLTALENLPGVDWPLEVAVVVTSAGSPMAVRPTQVRVGNHFDVQKRRQDQVAETYTTLNR